MYLKYLQKGIKELLKVLDPDGVAFRKQPELIKRILG